MPRRVGVTYRIIVDVGIVVEFLRIARSICPAAIVPQVFCRVVTRRDGKRTDAGHDAVGAQEAAQLRVVIPRVVVQQTGVVAPLPRVVQRGVLEVAFPRRAPRMVALPTGNLSLRVGRHRHAAQVVVVQVDHLGR
jgi:hypothetical protein